METTRPGNTSALTDRTMQQRDQDKLKNLGAPNANFAEAHLEEAVERAESRIRQLGQQVTSFTEKYHFDQLPEKAKNLLTSTKTLVIIGAGTTAVAAGLATKKWREARRQQPSFAQKIKAKVPAIHQKAA